MKTKKLQLTVHSDSGHGWIGVPRKSLIDLNLMNEISSFSYQKGSKVYLEEDSDASKFVKALFASKGKQYTAWNEINEFCTVKKCKQSNNRSPIRNYAGFCPVTIEASEVKEGQYIKVGTYYFFVLTPFDGTKITVKTAMGQKYKLTGINLDSIIPAKEEEN